MLREQAWIFFFDGLDEVPESSNRQEVLRQIHIFILIELKELSCDCMVIGTTRPQGYNNDFGETKYKHLVVAELSKKDCYLYIQKLFELMEEQTERREDYIRIRKEALEDEITCRLMKTPLQITIISILVKSGGKPPHERYSLFRQYCDTIIRREKQKEIVATLNDNTGWLEEIHYIIGDRLQCESEKAGNPSAEISKENLNTAIRAYVEENQDNFYESESGIAKKTEEFLMTITERVCFLCENRDGYYSFNIRSMQEYFAGTYLVKDRSDVEAMSNIEQIAYSSYWRNALLFALGYIELERKSLEPEIGRLCEQMNGRDNIMKSDYSMENLCLFGSWLAIDILAEDIFRGKQQDKYVVLTAKVLELEEFDSFKNFNNFSLITGAQRDKLLRYIKENYFEKEEFLEKIFMMYLKLNENNKNNLNAQIIEMTERFSEEQQLKLSIYILKNEISSSEDMLNIVDINANTMLKKNLFLQYLFCDNIFMIQRKFVGKLGAVMKTAISCFAPAYSFNDGNYIEKTISEGIEICVRDEQANKKELEELQAVLQQMGLDYLADFCSFLLKPSFEKYQQLYYQFDREEEYLRNRYKAILQEYVGNVVYDTEKEFNEWISMREADYEKIVGGDLKELQFRQMGVEFTISICGNCVLDELAEDDGICFGKLSRLNRQFFGIYMFAAEVQMEQMRQVSEMSEKTAQCIINIIYEANRRKYYRRQMFEIIGI